MCLIKDFDEIMLMSKRKAESNTIKETQQQKRHNIELKMASDQSYRTTESERTRTNEKQITSPIMRNTNDFNEKLGKQRN